MSVNLVSLASQYLTPDLIAKIASALGLDRSLVGKAVTALMPSLLGSFANVASTQDGARKLASAVSQQSPNILDSLRLNDLVARASRRSINGGMSTLSSLLGSSAVPALAGAVGKFAGIGQGPSSSLIGMLAPAVLGLLGKQQAAQGLDASGLAQLLASQKSNISAALPAGFSNLMTEAGLPGFTAAGAQAARAAQSTISQASRAALVGVPQLGQPGSSRCLWPPRLRGGSSVTAAPRSQSKLRRRQSRRFRTSQLAETTSDQLADDVR